MERQLSSDGSEHQEDQSELMEDSRSQDLSGELDEDSQLKDITEQVEDSSPQDPNEPSTGEIQIHLDTSYLESWEEREDSTIPASGSWETSVPNEEDKTSSFLAPEPSRSSHLSFLSSDTSGLEGTQDLTWTEASQELLSEDEAFPSSLWEKTSTEWTFERPGHPVPRQRPSFHSCCCNSAIEETIKHSPWKLTKSCVRGFFQKPTQKIKKREVTAPPSVGLKRKKEYKALFKAQPHTTSSCERTDGHLGRKSKALYNLYTTFCDDDKGARPEFLQRAEGYPATSGLARAITIFSNLKKGRINVSNLLLTLHTLGILIARADMHRALKYVAVDECGNLNFLEFLNVVTLITSVAGTKALQNARHVFRTVKKDMVAIKDLESTLACLGVTVSPMIIERALECMHNTLGGKVNISKFLSTVRELHSCCDKTEYSDEYPALNWSSFKDVNDMDHSELSLRSTCSSDREIPAYQIPMITFCSAEEAIAFTQLQKQKSKAHRPVDLKRPPARRPGEETKKDRLQWPTVRPGFGYTSQDTLFPLESTLRVKETENAHAQQIKTTAAENGSGKGDPSVLSSPNVNPKANPKKKRLSFFDELPKRFSAEDSRVPDAAQLETEGDVSTGDPSTQPPTPEIQGESTPGQNPAELAPF